MKMVNTFDFQKDESSHLELDSTQLNGLNRILENYCSYSGVNKAAAFNTNDTRWSAEFYSADRSSVFRSLTLQQQHDIVKGFDYRVLSEIQWVEVVAMSFANRMSSSAKTTSERELYSFIGSDEARHLHLINSIIGTPKEVDVQNNYFLKMVGDIIDKENRDVLVFFMQVILEGWGIHHYTDLSRACNDPYTKSVLSTIVQDEASHHGSGLLIFKEDRLASEDQKKIFGVMEIFMECLRSGPSNLINPIAQAAGGMNQAEVLSFLEETNFQTRAQGQLHYIHMMLLKSKAHKLVSHLKNLGAFDTINLQDCTKNLMPQLA